MVTYTTWVRLGNQYNNLPMKAYRRHRLKKYGAFVTALHKALARAEERDVRRVDAAIEAGDTAMLRWKMSRRWHERWGKKAETRVEHTGTVEHKNTIAIDVSQLNLPAPALRQMLDQIREKKAAAAQQPPQGQQLVIEHRVPDATEFEPDEVDASTVDSDGETED